MVKLLLSLSLLLLLSAASPAAAATITHAPWLAAILKPATGGGSGDACSGCTNETYEGTGYVVAGWSENLTTDEDYATAPAPLAGSQSLLLRNTGFDNANTTLVMPSDSEGWMRFRLNATNTIVTGLTICSFADNVSAYQATVRFDGGKLRAAVGATTAATVNSVSANTTYAVRVRYKAGTGNAICSVEFSTDGTFTGSGNNFAEVTTGTGANVQEYALNAADIAFSGAFGGVIFDSVSFRAGATPIGNY